MCRQISDKMYKNSSIFKNLFYFELLKYLKLLEWENGISFFQNSAHAASQGIIIT